MNGLISYIERCNCNMLDIRAAQTGRNGFSAGRICRGKLLPVEILTDETTDFDRQAVAVANFSKTQDFPASRKSRVLETDFVRQLAAVQPCLSRIETSFCSRPSRATNMGANDFSSGPTFVQSWLESLRLPGSGLALTV